MVGKYDTLHQAQRDALDREQAPAADTPEQRVKPSIGPLDGRMETHFTWANQQQQARQAILDKQQGQERDVGDRRPSEREMIDSRKGLADEHAKSLRHIDHDR